MMLLNWRIISYVCVAFTLYQWYIYHFLLYDMDLYDVSYPWRVLASRVILASTRVIGKRVTPGPLICMHVMCSYYSEWNSFPECWIRYVLAACCWIRYDATTGTAVLHYIYEYVLLLLGVCPSTISCVQDSVAMIYQVRDTPRPCAYEYHSTGHTDRRIRIRYLVRSTSYSPDNISYHIISYAYDIYIHHGIFISDFISWMF